MNYSDALREKINSTESLSLEIESLQKQVQFLNEELQTIAGDISQNRHNQVDSLEKQLVTLLKQVGIPEADIQIVLKDSEALNEFGKDIIELLFSANKGSKPDRAAMKQKMESNRAELKAWASQNGIDLDKVMSKSATGMGGHHGPNGDN